MRKKYNTPHRSRVVKTRLSEDEYADFTARLAPYGISLSEFLRQAIRRTTIRPVVHVSAVNDELLSAVGKLAAEYGRIGGNLNQIARYLNEYGSPYNALSGEVRAAIADLAALKYEILQAKEILKNPRPAGSWRPLKCIFSGKGKSRSQRAAKPRSGVILAKGKKAAHSGPQALS